MNIESLIKAKANAENAFIAIRSTFSIEDFDDTQIEEYTADLCHAIDRVRTASISLITEKLHQAFELAAADPKAMIDVRVNAFFIEYTTGSANGMIVNDYPKFIDAEKLLEIACAVSCEHPLKWACLGLD